MIRYFFGYYNKIDLIMASITIAAVGSTANMMFFDEELLSIGATVVGTDEVSKTYRVLVGHPTAETIDVTIRLEQHDIKNIEIEVDAIVMAVSDKESYYGKEYTTMAKWIGYFENVYTYYACFSADRLDKVENEVKRKILHTPLSIVSEMCSRHLKTDQPVLHIVSHSEFANIRIGIDTSGIDDDINTVIYKILPLDTTYSRHYGGTTYAVNSVYRNIVITFVDMSASEGCTRNVDVIILVGYRHDVLHTLRMTYSRYSIDRTRDDDIDIPIYLGILPDQSCNLKWQCPLQCVQSISTAFSRYWRQTFPTVRDCIRLQSADRMTPMLQAVLSVYNNIGDNLNSLMPFKH